MDTLKVISPQPHKSLGTAPAPPLVKGDSVATLSALSSAPLQDVSATPPDHEAKQQISSAVKDINDFFQMTQRSLGFTLDETSGVMVMQITDTKTGEMIRQIPGESALKLAKQLDELTGVLFKAQA
jgi:flagellar protein FlaG